MLNDANIGPSQVLATSGATILGIFLSLFLLIIPKNPEGVVVGFRDFAWAPGDLIFFLNSRRRLVRVLKLHRSFILTKKRNINPAKSSPTPFKDKCGGKFPLISMGVERRV